jgi:hypothetical protein
VAVLVATMFGEQYGNHISRTIRMSTNFSSIISPLRIYSGKEPLRKTFKKEEGYMNNSIHYGSL